jgi:hypothetical protein
MNEKKISAAQRVLKSVVAPALGTSLALLLGCTTTTPPQDKPAPVTDTAKPNIPLPGKIEPVTQGSTVNPMPAPGSYPTSATSTPVIPEPGKVIPEKVGKIAPPKVGKPPKVGTVTKPGVKVGIHIEPKDPLRGEPRPIRQQRRATDESGSLLRTGFTGGRTLT